MGDLVCSEVHTFSNDVEAGEANLKVAFFRFSLPDGLATHTAPTKVITYCIHTGMLLVSLMPVGNHFFSFFKSLGDCGYSVYFLWC